MEERLVLDMDGIDGNMTIFGEWPAFNPSSRTFISEFFNKDFVPRPILDFVEDDNQSSFITMEFEKKIPPISFEEEKKIGLDCTSDVSSELLGSNVQKSCLRRVQNERMATMACFNMLKANMSQSDQEKIMLKINSGHSETKNYISSLPEDCSSWMLLSPGVITTSQTESVGYFSNSMDASTIDQEQALPTNNASLQENLKLLPSSRRKENTQDIVADKKASDSLVVDESPLPPSDGHQNGETGPESEFSCFPGSDPAKDGYNWRKYGQKQLKGSDFPCSYHKCTHPNCPVKKKIERSIQGHVTEIIYRGFHNHPKPPPNYRSTIPSSKHFNGPPTDHLEGASPTSFTKLCGPSKFFKSSRLELAAIDALCPVSTDKDGNGATPGSSSVECDVDEEEMELKRRKQELVPSGNSAASRAMHEARIVVQIRSEDDIPDDGYRWRKYGQKIVKGNPNPRSYYKCSQLGCPVRKHVERASDDLKSVISTYEGKHNHDVPSARNINRPIHCPSSSPSATAALQLPSLYPSPDLAKNSFIKLEEGRAPMSAFGLLAPATSFSFDFNQSKWVSLRPSGSGSMGPFKVPFFSPMDQEMDRHRQDGGGNVMPGRKVKEEPM